ncbi:MAG: SURF1 family protein [Thiobacillaceae bacterium]
MPLDSRIKLAGSIVRIRLGHWQFTPGIWPTLAAIALIGLTLSLGNWQLHRAAYKRALQVRVDAAEHDPVLILGEEGIAKDHVLYRRVEVRGVFDPAHEILLDNRIENGIAGYHVLTPMRIEGGKQFVLINRGWIPVGKSRTVLPPIPRLVAQLKIVGIALDPNTRYFELTGAQSAGRVWQNLNFERYAAGSGLSLQPILLQQTNDTGDGLVRRWPRPDTGASMHTSYAIQWYGLAATLAVLWMVLNLKRNTSSDDITN